MSKNIIWLLLVALFLPQKVSSQNYSVSLLPDSLKENAHAVIRASLQEFELHSVNTATERVRTVITVLDENGEDYGNISISYDKNSKVNIKSAAIYDKNGKRIKKIIQSDFSDLPANSSATLYSDSRMKNYTVKYGEYPYTVEYVYEMSYSNLISYGRWYPLYGYNLSMENAIFSFIHPSEIEFRKKEFNMKSPSDIVNQGDKTVETWHCNAIKALEYEPFCVSFLERSPRVLIMPVTLIYDTYKGSAENWNEYGKWINELYAGRDELPENVKAKLQSITGTVADTIKKIRLLYRYLQENTRYVGIKLGIGGLQPFPASTVAETGYGDCKALTNYMHAMLRFFGIPSWPAVVSSGRYIETILRDFPNFQQFDHVILCVPLKRDTIWLECTNQIIPFGFLGDFTDNRDVLLITDNGGILAHTKKYSPADNTMVKTGEFKIGATGEAECSVSSRYKGLQFDDINYLFSENKEEQKKWIYQNSILPSQQIVGFDFSCNCRDKPEGTITHSIKSRDYCSASGNYMIMPLNMIDAISPVKKPLKERKSDFILQRATIDIDTIMYNIVPGLKVESLPPAKAINSDFGTYRCSAELKGNNILYTRRLEIKEGKYANSRFRDFYDFILAVSRADNDKVMLKKN
jgi:transglutaminase-like putative cysteine protease